ncbi:PepSY-like domain-containing protein [uncultured Alistipes sp.]|jgi:putative lipoprotein|uniref:PepSY-like domain-containing protein n=1 Tax=uncultured Alistipes sp. TaxID=538949 RepID=UPI0025D26196|nr:PepSY-like domain-containing protein [uncultured Alistipes sp.]
MKKFVLLIVAFLSLGAMTGCDDDNDSVNVPTAVQGVFEQMFPNAGRVEWKGKRGYLVAEFRDGTTDTQAWFDSAGKWYMTEVDMHYEQLPQAVRTAFESSEYAAWHVDDVDKLTREGLETVYVIEVEQGRQEFDLYYSEDGVLLRAVADTDGNDDHDNMLPEELSPAIRNFIAQKYPDARIVDAEREKGYIEVEIIDDRIPRDVYFGTDETWLRTKTEIRRSEVPTVVMQALQSSKYGGWEIDDIDHFVDADGEWYLFELEDPQSDREVSFRIEADGTIA